MRGTIVARQQCAIVTWEVRARNAVEARLHAVCKEKADLQRHPGAVAVHPIRLGVQVAAVSVPAVACPLGTCWEWLGDGELSVAASPAQPHSEERERERERERETNTQ